MKRTFSGMSLLLIAVLSGLFGGTASAATPGPGGDVANPPEQRVRFVGRIDSITDRGIVMTTRDRQVLVRLDDQTHIMVQRDDACVEGTLRNLQLDRLTGVVGVITRDRDIVLARIISQCRRDDTEQPGAAGSPAAGAAADTDTAPEQRVRFVGRVEAVTERGVAMTTRRGRVLVRVNDETRILVENKGTCVEGTLRDLQVGSPAMVLGITTREPGVVLARGIAQCRPSEKK